jgi:hypothetical protein
MISALEKFLLMSGKGLGKLKGMTMGEIPGAGLDAAKSLGRAGLASAKKSPKGAAAIGGAGAVGGYAAGRATDDDEETQLKLMIAQMRAQRGE